MLTSLAEVNFESRHAASGESPLDALSTRPSPEIPTKRNRKLQYTVNRAVYAMRNRIERFFNRLKESRRVATRYDHTAESFLGFAKLAAIKIWIRFVHAA